MKAWKDMTEKEKEKILKKKLPTMKQKQYSREIARVLKINPPEGDAWDYYVFISEYEKSAKIQFKKEAEEVEEESILMYLPIIQREDIEKLCNELKGVHGIYAFLGVNDEILYIGKSKNLIDRIPASYNERRKQALIKTIAYYPIENEADTNIMEIVLIAENKPQLNSESNSEDQPTMFHSNINVVNEFKRLPYDFSVVVEEMAKQREKEFWEKRNALNI